MTESEGTSGQPGVETDGPGEAPVASPLPESTPIEVPAAPEAPLPVEPAPVPPPPSRWQQLRAAIGRDFHLHVVALLAAMTGALLVSSQLIFITPWPVWINVDEPYITAFAWRMVERNWLPYVDAVSHRGPLLYWMAAIFVKVFGPNWYAIRFLGSLSLVWTGIGCMWAGWLARRPIAGLIGALGFAWYSLLGYPPQDGISFNGEPMLNVFAIAALVTLTSALGPRGAGLFAPRRLFLAGVFTTCGLLSKQVGGVLVFPFFLWVAANGLAHRRFWRSALIYAAGCALPLVVVFLRYAVAGELSTFWYYFIVYNRDVYLAPFANNYRDTFRNWAMANQTMFALGFTMLAAWLGRVFTGRGPALLGAARRWDALGFEGTVLLGVLVSGFASNSSLRGFGHYYLQVVPWTGLAVGVVAQRIFGAPTGLRGGVMTLVLVGPLFGWTAAGWIETRARIVEEQRRGFGWQANTEAELCAWIDTVSQPTDSILVWGFKAHAYINCKRFPATRYVFTTFPSGVVPWDAGASAATMAERVVPGSPELMIQDLEESKPQVVVDAADTMLHKSIVQFPLFKKYLDEHYCPRPAVMKLPVWVRKQADGTCPPAKP